MSPPPFLPENLLTNLDKKLSAPDGKKLVAALEPDFSDAAFLIKHYVQPHGQPKKPIEDREGETRPILGMVSRFLGKDPGPGQPHHRRSCLFLLGDAGMGKTSLLLLLKVAHLTGLWASPQDCVLRRLGPATLDDVTKIKTPRHTILLLDALNEDPCATEDLIQRVTEILKATRSFHRVIVSCRTPYFSTGRDMTTALGAFVSGGFRCPTIYLTPFSQSQTDNYLKRRFQRMKDPNRKQVRGLIHDMGPLRDRPLFLNHADDLLHSRRKSWNAFAAYETLIDAWLEREKGRLRASDKSAKLPESATLEACIRMAQRMHLSDSRHRIGKRDLDEADQPVIERLECQGRSLLRRVSGSDYRFTHVSLQEYLVALGLKKGMLPPGKQPLAATDLILNFLCLADDGTTAWRALDLKAASFHGIELRSPDFSRASLGESDFSESTLHNPNFDQAILTAWEAPRATFLVGSFQGAKSTLSNLHGATFSGTAWANSTLAGSELAEARFDNASLKHTLMADTDLSGAQFIKSSITDCSLKGARLSEVVFQGATLTQARFDHVCFKGARFQDTALENVSLQSADLRGATLDDSFLRAIKSGAAKDWKTAAWDPAIAAKLKLSSKENERNAQTIDQRR